MSTTPTLTTADSAVLTPLETPCYLLDPAAVAEDLRDLRAALGTGVVVSVKASPVLDLLVRCNAEFVDGIEIASLGELNLTVGRLSVPRFVNTPAMDATLIAAALACKATLVADGPQQIALIEEALRKPALQARGPQGIVLRINAASLLERTGPHADHFGMDLATLHRELDRFSSREGAPRVVGLHVFAGSHSFSNTAVELAERLNHLVEKVLGYPAAALEFVMIGTGLPANWRDADIDFAPYRAALEGLQTRVKVLHEAGRAVFSRSGRFVTRVVAVKPLNQESVVVCDGGMAQCFALAQTEQFVKRWREPVLVPAEARDAPNPARAYTVVGNSCNRADVIGRLTSATEPRPGDWLVFDHSGAYHSYSPTGFLNLRPARRYLAS